MSCNYADGLSHYENKGVLGIPEKFDTKDEIEKKCMQLVEWLEVSKHVVVHTGAGISTSAGIPDFRGPKGVWTLENKGEKPHINISFNDAAPTKTHMALRALIEKGYIHYIISQNIDGLHLKSGLARKYLAELHGNMFIEQCSKCRRQFVRSTAAETVGQKPCGGQCRRKCRGGVLIDNILDWEHDLPERDFDMAAMHSSLADLNITLGTTLQIIPSGTLPLKNKRFNGKLVICNLQPTKYDKKANLVVSTYVDDILTKVCKRLGIEIPEYNIAEDPTKTASQKSFEWTLPMELIKELDKVYTAKVKLTAQQRKEEKAKPAKKRKFKDEFDDKDVIKEEKPKKRLNKSEEELQEEKVEMVNRLENEATEDVVMTKETEIATGDNTNTEEVLEDKSNDVIIRVGATDGNQIHNENINTLSSNDTIKTLIAEELKAKSDEIKNPKSDEKIKTNAPFVEKIIETKADNGNIEEVEKMIEAAADIKKMEKVFKTDALKVCEAEKESNLNMNNELSENLI